MECVKKKKRKKSRMGRPPLGKEARMTTLSIRASEIELAVWRKAAKAAGMPLGPYLLAPRREELKQGE